MSNKCSGCGTEITWIKTKAGNYNPCDLPILNYSNSDNPMVVSKSGHVGRLSELLEGYISHFSTCPNAKNFRRGK